VIGKEALAERLQDIRPILLDGGLGRELMRRGLQLPDSIWSGFALLEDPEVVYDIHRDFVAAGAEVLTTNTYGITRASLTEAGSAYVPRYKELIALAVELARAAIADTERPIFVVGSMPPSGRSYRCDLQVAAHEMAVLYNEHAAHLAEAGVDGLLAETLTSLAEAEAALVAGQRVGLQTWISFTLDEYGLLRSGPAFAEAVARLADLGATAVLANCSTPAAISKALTPEVCQIGLPVGGYANAFVPIPPDYSYADSGPMRLATDVTPAYYRTCCAQWLENGAKIVGGCCGIGPDYIAALRTLLPT
jgi:S-methylmethionine-dependent homocysteine/selenocysteine methylase